MRVPSRRLPPLTPSVHLAVRWGCGLLVIAGAGATVWHHLLAASVFLAVAWPFFWWVVWAERRRVRRFAETRPETRPGESLCRFARDFDCRAVDTWLVRATFEEVRGKIFDRHCPLFLVRADDRLWEDLRIDEDTLEEMGVRVAERAGYSLNDTRDNPLYARIKTARDLVAFMCHQPCTRAV